MQAILDATRAALALSFLLHASWSDYKTREVSNSVWILFAPPAFALTFAELLVYEPSQLLLYGLCFGLTAAFAIILFYSGGFGGADAKALMCLALALPFYPVKLLTPVLGEASPISRTFFPITIFSNSVLFAALTAVAMFLYNVFWRLKTGNKLFERGHEKESTGKKILVLITGYKVSINALKEKWHVYPLEDIEEDAENKSNRKLLVLPKDEGREEIVKRLDAAITSGNIQGKLWASPGLPMLIFVTAGLIIALLFGDIVWICIRFLLR
jgi:preflagellin peptidase FlaK